MLQSVIKGRGGTIETYFLGGQPVSCTVSLYDGNGSAKVSAAAGVVDTVSTTISAAADAGDTEITVVSATGLVAGRRYLLGVSPGAEVVGVKDIVGLVVTLWAPLVYGHASAETLKGLRVSCAVDATAAASVWWDGYAVFTPLTGDENTETVDCVRRKIPEALIDETDIRMIIPKDQAALSAELDRGLAYRAARDNMLMDLGGKNRAQTILGVDHFRRPCAIRFWLDRRTEFGEEWAPQMKVLEGEYERLLEQIVSQAPVDADQDGATNGPEDRGFTVIQLERC